MDIKYIHNSGIVYSLLTFVGPRVDIVENAQKRVSATFASFNLPQGRFLNKQMSRERCYTIYRITGKFGMRKLRQIYRDTILAREKFSEFV